MNLMWNALAGMVRLIPPQVVKEVIDDALDKFENWAAENPGDVRATAVLAGCNFIRNVADIPDDIGGDED